jgi:hypothetical protein
MLRIGKGLTEMEPSIAQPTGVPLQTSHDLSLSTDLLFFLGEIPHAINPGSSIKAGTPETLSESEGLRTGIQETKSHNIPKFQLLNPCPVPRRRKGGGVHRVGDGILIVMEGFFMVQAEGNIWIYLDLS